MYNERTIVQIYDVKLIDQINFQALNMSISRIILPFHLPSQSKSTIKLIFPAQKHTEKSMHDVETSLIAIFSYWSRSACDRFLYLRCFWINEFSVILFKDWNVSKTESLCLSSYKLFNIRSNNAPRFRISSFI